MDLLRQPEVQVVRKVYPITWQQDNTLHFQGFYLLRSQQLF